MQTKPNAINHIAGALPTLRHKILLSPRRSYAQLQQALQRAEDVAERTLCELQALRQSQQLAQQLGTPDKLQMLRQLQFMIKQGQRHDKGFALLYVQLDHYPNIVQRYGVAVAQQVVELAQARMLSVLRECDSISQQADDQFLLVITDVVRIYDVVLVAEKLMQKLALLHGICAEPLAITVSIGIGRYPEDGNNATLLIERATAAMLTANDRGGNQFSLVR